MSALLALLFGLAAPTPDEKPDCANPASERDRQVCDYLKRMEEFEIRTIESVAVGSIAEMQRVREMTRPCNVSNRIDHLGAVDLGIYDIVNADDVARACVTGWIEQNAPDLAFTQERYSEKFRNAPLLKEPGE